LDIERAQEIIQSPETIYVTFQNTPVWLDEIKDEDRIVIRDLNSDTKMEVAVEELVELGAAPNTSPRA
jgi:H-type small acid-soluble spore protein